MDFEEQEKLPAKDDDKSPDWHIPIVMEAREEYKANPGSAMKWEDLKKEWDNEL